MPRFSGGIALSENASEFFAGDGAWRVPGIPAGVICLWGGPVASIPAGWALCDGSGGRPDLRSKFVKGSAPGIDPGATGGAATHSHTYSDVVSHTHAVSVNDPGHTHSQSIRNTGTAGTAGTQGGSAANNATAGATVSAQTGISASTVAPAGSVATGTTATASSEPVFYSLAFIQKL